MIGCLKLSVKIWTNEPLYTPISSISPLSVLSLYIKEKLPQTPSPNK